MLYSCPQQVFWGTALPRHPNSTRLVLRTDLSSLPLLLCFKLSLARSSGSAISMEVLPQDEALGLPSKRKSCEKLSHPLPGIYPIIIIIYLFFFPPVPLSLAAGRLPPASLPCSRSCWSYQGSSSSL